MNGTPFVCCEITGISQQNITDNIYPKYHGTQVDITVNITVNIGEYANLLMNDEDTTENEKKLK